MRAVRIVILAVSLSMSAAYADYTTDSLQKEILQLQAAIIKLQKQIVQIQTENANNIKIVQGQIQQSHDAQQAEIVQIQAEIQNIVSKPR